MSVRADALLWAQRIVNRQGAPAHQLLDVKADATMDEIQTAFHEIARSSHPDLHRTTLNADELELLTTAYSRVAAAYQELRSARMVSTRMKAVDKARMTTGSMKPLEKSAPAGSPSTAAAQQARTTGSIKPLDRGTPLPPAPGEGAMRATLEMTSKALVYYRKAELELRRGDLKMALLQMKLAIAADPQSGFLRSALAELQAELAKT